MARQVNNPWRRDAAHEAPDHGEDPVPATPVHIVHVTVRPDRIVADVRISSERFAMTDPALIDALLGRFPHLMRHTCVNGKGSTFAAVAHNTSVAHLLEHMAIEEQVRLSDSVEASFVGKTAWTDRRRLRARVEVSYANDLVALEALRRAHACLNDALLRRIG